MTDSICAFPPNKVTQLDPKEPNEQMPSLWSDNGGLLWLTPQALAIFLELKNKIGKRKKGHNFYQANPPWEITVYVPVHEHTWVIFFFSLFSWLFTVYFSLLLQSGPWGTWMLSSWPFTSLCLGYRNFSVVATCRLLSKGWNINSTRSGCIVEGEVLTMNFAAYPFSVTISEIWFDQKMRQKPLLISFSICNSLYWFVAIDLLIFIIFQT